MVKIFCGSLLTDESSSDFLTEDDLREIFGKYGSVLRSERVRGKNYAFIHVADTRDAHLCLAGVNDTCHKGQKLFVEISRSVPIKFWVGSLPEDCTEKELKQVFVDEGATVLACDIMVHKHFAFVHVESNSDKFIGDKLIEALNGRNIKGKFLKLQFSDTVKKEKKERGSTDGWEGDGRDDMAGGGGSQVGRGRGRGGAAHFRERPSPYPTGNMNMNRPPHNNTMFNNAPMMMNNGGMVNPMMNGGGMVNPMMNNSGMVNPMMNSGGMGNPMMNNSMSGNQRRVEMDERRSNSQKLGLDWVAASSTDNQSSARTEKGFEQSLRDFELKISFSVLGVLGDNLTQLVQEGRFVDTHISCNGTMFKCHGLVLSAKSTFLADKLKVSEVVEMNDFEPVVVNTLLQFMYTGHINIPDRDSVLSIISCANRYQIDGATDATIVALAKDLQVSNVISTLQLAVNSDIPDLKSFCTKFILENKRDILGDPVAKVSLKQFPDIMLEIMEAMSLS